MRICLVSLDLAPFRSSGLAVYAENLAKGLSEAGHEVVVMTGGSRQDTLRAMDGRVHDVISVPLGATNWIGYAYRVSRMLRETQQKQPFDVVHFLDVHFAYAYPGSFVASIFQSFRQRLTAMGGLPYSSSRLNLLFRFAYYSLAKVLLEARSVKNASRLIAASRAVRDEFVNHYRADTRKVDVVGLGVDTGFFQKRDAEELRRRLNLQDQAVLLYVGFSTPRKGLEYLGQALSLLEEDTKLIVLGRWERGYRRRFLQAVGDRASNVIEVGYVPDAEMPCYYSLADILVLPSLLEGFGLPIVEAMACATPVVATDVGSIPEVVGSAGILVPPRDHRALADGIKRILKEDALRHQLGSAARNRARRYFSRERMIADTLDVYRRFVGEQTSS